MLASFLLALREGVEAALIIGIVLAALHKMDQTNLSSAVWRGVLTAAGTSLLAGLALSWLGAGFEGRAEEIFEGTVMLSAAALLTWVILWMSRQAANLKTNLEANVQRATVAQGSRRALFWLSFLAVGREGLELALFLVATQMATDARQTAIGAVLGLAMAIVLGGIFFTSTKHLSLRPFFRITNGLLTLFAAGLIARGIHEFNEAGLVPSVIEHVWDLNPVVNESRFLGQLLNALFGYNANPSLTEITSYLAYFLSLGLLWKIFMSPSHTSQPAQNVDQA